MYNFFKTPLEFTIGGMLLNLDSRNPTNTRDSLGNIVLPSNGSAITTWKDLSGKGYDRSQATIGFAPLFNSSEKVPFLQFNGSYLHGAAVPNLPYGTIIMIYQGLIDDPVAECGALIYNGNDGGGANTNGYSYGLKALNVNRTVLANGVNFLEDGASTNNKEITIITNNGITNTISVNGNADSLTNPSTMPNALNGSSVGIIGASNYPAMGDSPFLGRVYKILQYDRVLSTAEQQKLITYFGAIYGVAVNQSM